MTAIAAVTAAPARPAETEVSRRQGPAKWRGYAVKTLSVIAAVGIWQLLTAGHVRFWLRFDNLPTVTQIAAKFIERLGATQYWLDLTQSVIRIVSGFGLAAVGASQDEPPRQPGYVARVMNWLRADYPNGVPTQDYLPVLAVLRPQLDDADMAAIADQLAQDARDQGVAPSEADARDAIQRATEDEPKPEEIARIRAMLAAHGWPFEGE